MSTHWKSCFPFHFHGGKSEIIDFSFGLDHYTKLALPFANLMKFLLMRIRLLLTHKQGEDINNKGHLAANRGQR